MDSILLHRFLFLKFTEFFFWVQTCPFILVEAISHELLEGVSPNVHLDLVHTVELGALAQ